MTWLDPRAWLAVLLVTAAAAGGWTVRGWREASRALDAQHQQRREEFRRGELVDQAAVDHETERARLAAAGSALDKEIDRAAQKPFNRGVCLDPDGLRILGAAIDGTADPGEPAPAVPAAAEARRRKPRRDAAVGKADGAGLPPVR